MTLFFSWSCMTNSRHHSKLSGFSRSFTFAIVFSAKKVNKCLDVSQLSYGVENRSNQEWMPNIGLPMCLQKLGSIQWCCNGGCSGWLEGSIWKRVFYICQMTPKFFHHLLWPIQGIMPSYLDFWQILQLLKFCRWKEANKWLDVSQRANGVKSRLNLAWMPHNCCNKLESFIHSPENH